MARVTGQQWAEKWGRRLKGSTQDIASGIARVSEAPGVAAAKQAGTMLTNLAARVQDGTWQKNVAGVSLQDWQKAATTKGVPRIAAGVDQAMPNAAAMADRLLSAVDQAVAIANQQPRGDLEANINRSATFQREMAKRAPSRNK